jgi:hypothetical protein
MGSPWGKWEKCEVIYNGRRNMAWGGKLRGGPEEKNGWEKHWCCNAGIPGYALFRPTVLGCRERACEQTAWRRELS